MEKIEEAISKTGRCGWIKGIQDGVQEKEDPAVTVTETEGREDTAPKKGEATQKIGGEEVLPGNTKSEEMTKAAYFPLIRKVQNHMKRDNDGTGGDQALHEVRIKKKNAKAKEEEEAKKGDEAKEVDEVRKEEPKKRREVKLKNEDHGREETVKKGE